MRTFAATAGRPGANFIGTLVTGRKRGMDWIARSVTHMRDAGAELIVASLHWGPNMRTAPPSWFRKFGHDIIDRGVDVIHGHSAHVFQGVERYRNGLILYDGGDLIDDYWKFPFCETFWTYIFLLDINPDGTTRLRLVPAENHFESHRSPARLATGRLARRMNARMIAMCRALDTDVDETPDGLSITGPTIVRQ
jgi:poly-gamma-glutamate synthesis protein (capsule biosynthesis protein)